MKCIYCGQEIDEGSVFCGYCGKEQPKVKYCIKCGQEIGLDDAFCGSCGASQNVEIQEASIEKEKQEAPNEVVQTVNDVSTEKSTADVTPQSQKAETVDEADEKQDSKEEHNKPTTPTEPKEKVFEDEKQEKHEEDDGNESSESTPPSFNEDDASNNTKKFIIIALAAALILFGGYGAYLLFLNKSDSDIAAKEDVIDNKSITLKGTINNKIGFTMQLSVTGNTVEGTEHYDNQREDVNLIVRGSKSDNGTIFLSEYDGSTTAGTFEGTIENGVFSGNFTNAKGKSFPFYAEVSKNEKVNQGSNSLLTMETIIDLYNNLNKDYIIQVIRENGYSLFISEEKLEDGVEGWTKIEYWTKDVKLKEIKTVDGSFFERTEEKGGCVIIYQDERKDAYIPILISVLVYSDKDFLEWEKQLATLGYKEKGYDFGSPEENGWTPQGNRGNLFKLYKDDKGNSIEFMKDGDGIPGYAVYSIDSNY